MTYEQNTKFLRFAVFLGVAFFITMLIVWSDIASNDISRWEFYWSVFVFLLFSVAFVLYAFYAFRRARLIEDIATAKVRSAHQGYVELEGRARPLPGKTLIAPLTKRECCWYSYSITDERENHKGKSRSESGNSDEIPFLLEDDTGTCLIDPRDAEITTEHEKQWSTNQEYPNPDHVADGLFDKVTFKFSEAVLLEHDAIYAVGYFHTLDDSSSERKQAQFSREILRDWKNDQAALLHRFDGNRDGKLDQEEWDRAKQSAADQASARVAEMLRRFPHRLSRPESRARGQKFLVSNISQSELAHDFRERAKISVWFSLYNCLLVLVLLARYGL